MSHLGFAVGTHFCGGLAVESKLLLGHSHLDCGMSDMDTSCERKSQTKTYLDKIPCCDNEYFSIDVEDNFTPVAKVINFNNLSFVTAYLLSFNEIFSSNLEKPKYTYFPPPRVKRIISTLYQVFLI